MDGHSDGKRVGPFGSDVVGPGAPGLASMSSVAPARDPTEQTSTSKWRLCRRDHPRDHLKYAARGLLAFAKACDASEAISVAPALSKWALSPLKVSAAAAV